MPNSTMVAQSVLLIYKLFQALHVATKNVWQGPYKMEYKIDQPTYMIHKNIVIRPYVVFTHSHRLVLNQGIKWLLSKLD